MGSSRTIRVNVRVIAATNRDLDRAVREGKFRDDLLYRLNVFPIHVPPLRERVSDVSLLVGFFTAHLARSSASRSRDSTPAAWSGCFATHGPATSASCRMWPSAAILSPGLVLDVEESLLGSESPSHGGYPGITHGFGRLTDKKRLEEVERSHIISVLRTTGGVVAGGKASGGNPGIASEYAEKPNEQARHPVALRRSRTRPLASDCPRVSPVGHLAMRRRARWSSPPPRRLSSSLALRPTSRVSIPRVALDGGAAPAHQS